MRAVSLARVSQKGLRQPLGVPVVFSQRPHHTRRPNSPLPQAWVQFANDLRQRPGNPDIYERELRKIMGIAPQHFEVFGPVALVKSGITRGIFNRACAIVSEAIAYSDIHGIARKFREPLEIIPGPFIGATAPFQPNDELSDGILGRRSYYQTANEFGSVGQIDAVACWDVKANGCNGDIVDVAMEQFNRRQTDYWAKGGRVQIFNPKNHQRETFDVIQTSELAVPRWLFIAEPHYQNTPSSTQHGKKQPDPWLPGKVIHRKKYPPMRLISLLTALNDLYPLAADITQGVLANAAPVVPTQQWEKGRIRNSLLRLLDESSNFGIDLLALGDVKQTESYLQDLFREDLLLFKVELFLRNGFFRLSKGSPFKPAHPPPQP